MAYERALWELKSPKYSKAQEHAKLTLSGAIKTKNV